MGTEGTVEVPALPTPKPLIAVSQKGLVRLPNKPGSGCYPSQGCLWGPRLTPGENTELAQFRHTRTSSHRRFWPREKSSQEYSLSFRPGSVICQHRHLPQIWNVKSSGPWKASLWTKLVEVMEFQLSSSKSWKMMLWKCCTQNKNRGPLFRKQEKEYSLKWETMK